MSLFKKKVNKDKIIQQLTLENEVLQMNNIQLFNYITNYIEFRLQSLPGYEESQNEAFSRVAFNKIIYEQQEKFKNLSNDELEDLFQEYFKQNTDGVKE